MRLTRTKWTTPWACQLLVAASSCAVFEPLHEDSGIHEDGSELAATMCPGVIKINEVDGATTGSASDREFIEIVNTSDDNVTVGGIVIARQRGTGPDVGKARAIPDGYVLAPQGFLYLVANQADAEEGLQFSGCVDAAPTPCLKVSWDINADGESLYLLSRDKTEILCEVPYPRTVAPGDAWGRLPDGSNEFGPVRPTPGAPNRAP
jgi:hypothetical protein